MVLATPTGRPNNLSLLSIKEYRILRHIRATVDGFPLRQRSGKLYLKRKF
jgi:hypothetical protein